jgi:hypothetical protein
MELTFLNANSLPHDELRRLVKLVVDPYDGEVWVQYDKGWLEYRKEPDGKKVVVKYDRAS